MVTAVVTGCAGFIASHLVERLIASDYDVIGIDNMYSGQMENMETFASSTKFRFIEDDISKEDFGTDIKENVDVIFHLAAISSIKFSVENPIFVNRTNVIGTLNLLELARRKDVDRFIVSSSAAVYGDPTNLPIEEDIALSPLSPYAASKIAGEEYTRSYNSAYDIDTVILRYFNVYGPRQAYSEYSGVISIFANRAVKGLPLQIEGDGLQTRSFVYVEDVVRATILAAHKKEASGQTFNVSSNESITIKNLADLIVDTCKEPRPEIVHIDPRIGDVRDSIGSMDKAEKVLGYTEDKPFKDGLENTLEWYRDHVH